MYAKKYIEVMGDYLTAEGERVYLETADSVSYPPFTPQELGYTEFASLEECLEAWGLSSFPITH